MVSRQPLVFRRPIAALVVACILSSAGRTRAQSPACASPDCLAQNQIWAPAAQIHEIKNQFVAAIRQFTEAVAGTFGDEGPRLASGLEATRRMLTQWDEAIRTYESMMAGLPPSAEVHVALGTVYLDRHRTADALKELAAAGRLDARRPDVYTLSALAYGLADKPADAADALRAASRLDGGDPISQYGLAQQLSKLDRDDQAADALRSVQESLWRRLRTASERRPSAPFERVSLLRQVAGVAPIFPLQAYRAGFALLLAGQYDAAVAELTRAASTDPLASPGAPEIAAGGSALRRGELRNALRVLENSIATRANGSEGHRILGAAYWADEQYDKSIEQLREAIRQAPHDERSRLALGDVLVDAKKPAEAEQAFADAIQAIPDSGQAHYRLGQLFQSRSLLPQAAREFEAAAALGPLVGLDRLYETIGGLYANQASFDEAVRAYLKRIDANPNNAGAHKALGEIYFLQGRHDEALAEFAATILIDPRNAGALVGGSQVFLRLGRFEDALDLSTQALAIDARLKDARYALATSLMRLGRQEEGKRELDVFERMQAEVMADTQRQSQLNTTKRDAARLLEERDYSGAATLLRKALALDAGAADLNRDLGVALLGAGRADEAVPPLLRAVQLQDAPDVHRLLAQAYSALGQRSESDAQTALAERVSDRVKVERLQKLNGAR
jgi:tetratricopeptide (TPR) repeat protein